jgi:hypothetical protein
MSDPVAEAAAQLAQEAGTPAVGEQQTADTSPSAPAMVAEAPTSTVASDAPQQAAELPNDGLTSGITASESGMPVASSSADVPNVAPAAVESTTEPGSAPSADGANITSPIAESSVEPLHVRVAAHLEAIFQMVKTDAERAPTEAESHAGHVKTHIGDVLHRISNGMAVAEGEMVQKLEALYRML